MKGQSFFRFSKISKLNDFRGLAYDCNPHFSSRYKKWFLKADPYQNSMHIDAYLVGTRCPLNTGYLL